MPPASVISGPNLPQKTMLEGQTTYICFSHLRWDFVFQRPQHLMVRLARQNKVLFWEEPGAPSETGEAYLDVRLDSASGVTIVTPRVPETGDYTGALFTLLSEIRHDVSGSVVLWYYTPMMLPLSRKLEADCIVYDCMDELSNFKFAPPELIPLETELLQIADLVFTGGYSLYEAKRDRHPRIYPFPSSVERGHFAQARGINRDPEDQVALPHPRLGFYGVIDERIDLEMIAAVADAHPEWSLVMVGPVVKIGEAELPRRSNIYYLGNKGYGDLPEYLSGWDVALMPFAINEATRFISPTKTPEYLAAGCPVVSTPVTDVVRHYGDLTGVEIADTPAAFIAACERALELRNQTGWRDEADEILATMDWDTTVAQMTDLIAAQMRRASPPLSIVSPAGIGSAHDYDVMIVGAGFAGAVMAERLATQANKKVLVVDRRPHVGGNAYDHFNDAGVLIHEYGPHIFHTNSADIFEYLSQFTEWRPYEHRVLGQVDGQRVPIPINRTTLNMLYGLQLSSDAEAAAYLETRRETLDSIETSEDVVVAAVGRELYEKFFRGYTRKQWGLDPSQLDKAVTARVPTRTDTDDRYFSDRYQVMPLHGYTKMFEKMLDHPNIDILLGADYRDVQATYGHDHLVFTGPIDEYFGHRYGKLPYRSLRFEHETLDVAQLQPVAVVNYPDEAVPYTRITEYKHLTGQEHDKTSITREFPCDEGDPYYPIPRAENQALFKRYEALAMGEPNVSFVGRLATYRYYNMDQIVGQALATFRRTFAVTIGRREELPKVRVASAA